jgi:hypothetical protein
VGNSNFSESLSTLLNVEIVPATDYPALFQRQRLLQTFRETFAHSTGKGVDRLNGFQFASRADPDLAITSAKCLNGSYRFSPYLESLQLKGRGKHPRVISIPTIRDRVVLNQLKDFLFATFPHCVPSKIASRYVTEISQQLSVAEPNETLVYGCDIKDFYGTIDQRRLLDIVEQRIGSGPALDLVRHSLLAPTIPKNTKRKDYGKFRSTRGIPQGLAISNILAAIYLDEVDRKMAEFPIEYYRYVDDIFIFGPTEDVRTAQRSLVARLRHRRLGVHPVGSGKSHFSTLDRSFGYLGYLFRLPLITVRAATVEHFLQNVAAKFSEYRHNKKRRLERHKYLNEARLKEIFLLELNERITGAISEKTRYGWIAYFSQINDLTLLHRLNKVIRRFFHRLEDFGRTAPKELKSLVRAYFEMRHTPLGGYIRNYDLITSRPERLAFLVERGRIAPNETLTDQQINDRFEAYKRRILSLLQPDESTIY